MAQRYGKWRNVGELGRGGQAYTYLVVEEGVEPVGHYVLKRLGTDRPNVLLGGSA